MKNNQFGYFLKSDQGFSVIEIMVAVGLMMIVSLGVSTIMSNMQKEQRRMALLQTLTSQKIRFENIILNKTSWESTMSADISMACLRNQTACNTIPVRVNPTETVSYNTGYQSLTLKNADGQNFYTFAGADGAIQGFTEKGESCNTFTTAAGGNDACPIGYRVSWAPHNISIVSPKITVYAKMIFNPSDSNPFKTYLNATAASTSLNTKYDVVIDRTAGKVLTLDTACLPSTTTSCEITNGNGMKTCDSVGAGYGACTVVSCNSGYYRSGDSCQLRNCTPNSTAACARDNGTGTNTCYGNGAGYNECTLTACNTGFYLSAGSCLPQVCIPANAGPCAERNGTGTKLCNADGSSAGACVLDTCNSGYYLSAADTCTPWVCTPNSSEACAVTNGTGSRTCNALGSAWGACTATSCNSGYTLSGGVCGQNYEYSWRTWGYGSPELIDGVWRYPHLIYCNREMPGLPWPQRSVGQVDYSYCPPPEGGSLYQAQRCFWSIQPNGYPIPGNTIHSCR